MWGGATLRICVLMQEGSVGAAGAFENDRVASVAYTSHTSALAHAYSRFKLGELHTNNDVVLPCALKADIVTLTLCVAAAGDTASSSQSHGGTRALNLHTS